MFLVRAHANLVQAIPPTLWKSWLVQITRMREKVNGNVVAVESNLPAVRLLKDGNHAHRGLTVFL